jgi:Leucine-rich repeat (LRR) protein
MEHIGFESPVLRTDAAINNQIKPMDDHAIILAHLGETDPSKDLWRAQLYEKPLDLSYKEVSDIPESILPKVKHYSTVILSNTNITRLPKTLPDFTQISTLDMSRCHMKELSPAIGSLTELRYLILDHNELSFLPETIGKLTKLLELNVAYNNLRELPGTYGFLSSLKFLNLSHNELTALPTEIGKLQNLESIIASHNQIRVVNPSIGSMSKLWSIILSHNPVERVPSTLVKIIPRLSVLDLEFTPLYDHVFSQKKNKFQSIAEYLFSLPTDITVSLSTFTRDMRNILNSPTFSDMKFKHGEQIYNGHRCIISARLHRVKSDLLCMEQNIMETMKTKDCIITIKDSVPAGVFDAILSYLYVADVTKVETIKDYIMEIPKGSTAEQLLAADLGALLKSGDFSDISFTVDTQEVKGHKCILAATCKTLSTFFTGEWKEARESTANLGGFSVEAVGSFFEYLYAGNCDINGENVMELLAVADMFHVDRLKEQCEYLLVDGIDEENLLLIYEAAERQNAHQLIENCAYFASRNYSREAYNALPQRLRTVAHDLVARTKQLSETMKSTSVGYSVVHKTEEERNQTKYSRIDETSPTASNDWGKLKGYNIKDPSEVLPSGKEETDKFLEKVMRDLNDPLPARNKYKAPRKRILDEMEQDMPQLFMGMNAGQGMEMGMNMNAPMGMGMNGQMGMNMNAPIGTGMNGKQGLGNVNKTGIPTPPNFSAETLPENPTPIPSEPTPIFSLNDNPFQAQFGFGQETVSNTLSTSPSTEPNMFAFSFSASPSKNELGNSPSRTRSPNKSGKKSPRKNGSESIFGDNEKEKSMEQLLSRLNFNEQ